MGRQSRITRRSGVEVKLTARDEALLRGLARFRIARTGDLLALFFAEVRRDTAAQRLRRLYDSGFLDVRSTERSEENLYSLGPQGRDWLKGKSVSVGSVPRGSLPHHLAIVKAWSGLAAATHSSPIWQLEHFRPDWEIRERAGSPGLPLVPDALVQLRRNEPGGQCGPVRFALEVDRRTERPPELQRKLRQYEELRSSPGGIFGWSELGIVLATIGTGPRRRAAVEAALREAWGSWWLLWESGEPADRVLERLSSTPLTGTPSGKGRDAALSDDVARRETMTETGP